MIRYRVTIALGAWALATAAAFSASSAGGERPTEAEARTYFAEADRFLNTKCSHYGADCLNAASKAVYNLIALKNYSKAEAYLDRYPTSFRSDLGYKCDGMWWQDKKKNTVYKTNYWTARYIVSTNLGNSGRKVEDQFLYGFLCEALGFNNSRGAAPTGEFPTSIDDYVVMAAKISGRRRADELKRFNTDIAQLYRQTWIKTFDQRLPYNKQIALQLGLAKNAKDEAIRQGFSGLFVQVLDEQVQVERYRLQLAEKTK
ncbi:hypothetical protein [Rhizobium phaseoli]|uniref:DUF1311 domain-containing protein n=1 Tax=Rhizobium phaseoli TaxID=396 RepID=A0ABN4QTJ9_9HYPH|nr:hypothetical protein [Rhizobium phaseoli]ANL87099.1 hypothetical protein AMC81_PA00078 [Rhizobium phaseoli]ANL93608.1 hypothetical protein AMC80_PA00078 [Rhizobium phaseoli]